MTRLSLNNLQGLLNLACMRGTKSPPRLKAEQSHVFIILVKKESGLSKAYCYNGRKTEVDGIG